MHWGTAIKSTILSKIQSSHLPRVSFPWRTRKTRVDCEQLIFETGLRSTIETLFSNPLMDDDAYPLLNTETNGGLMRCLDYEPSPTAACEQSVWDHTRAEAEGSGMFACLENEEDEDSDILSLSEDFDKVFVL